MFDWIIHHILASLPVWFWPAIAGTGLLMYFFAGILTKFRGLKLYGWLIKPVAAVVFVLGVFMFGGAGVTAIWQEQIKQAQAQVDLAVVASKTANDKLDKVRKQKNKVIVQRQVVIHDRIVKDSAKIDATCRVAPEAIQDLNDAATNPEAKK
jgi:hypothetical protein